jgi:hypothetical protein
MLKGVARRDDDVATTGLLAFLLTTDGHIQRFVSIAIVPFFESNLSPLQPDATTLLT